jgi:DNA-binding transcriptional MocR family regulator
MFREKFTYSSRGYVFCNKKETNFMRLSFASCELEEIDKGVDILKEVLEGESNENGIYLPII